MARRTTTYCTTPAYSHAEALFLPLPASVRAPCAALKRSGQLHRACAWSALGREARQRLRLALRLSIFRGARPPWPTAGRRKAYS